MNQKPYISCSLWSINRWLRYTGVRLAVMTFVDEEGEFYSLGLVFWGWSFRFLRE